MHQEAAFFVRQVPPAGENPKCHTIFVQPKWFSDIFHVVTFRRYKTWAIAQIIEEAIVFFSRGQVEGSVHPWNADLHPC